VKEDEFVTQALLVAEGVTHAPLHVKRGASLLYQVGVDNRLKLTSNPLDPRRGRGAFQTDLCIFDQIDVDIAIPRIVLEFKVRLTTHDVLTYSAKAAKHKQVYPYLRYGLILSGNERVPSRFYRHNEGLDFCIAVGGLSRRSFQTALRLLLRAEIAASKLLEDISFERSKARLYRTEVVVKGVQPTRNRSLRRQPRRSI
jgi:hypothetical protein